MNHVPVRSTAVFRSSEPKLKTVSQRIYCGKYGIRHARHKHGKLLKTNVFLMESRAAKSSAMNVRVAGF